MHAVNDPVSFFFFVSLSLSLSLCLGLSSPPLGSPCGLPRAQGTGWEGDKRWPFDPPRRVDVVTGGS